MYSKPSLLYVVKQGTGAGISLYPHLHRDGNYVASFTRFKKDYIRVRTKAELIQLVKLGYKIRMSNSSHPNHKAASLVKPMLII
jgi:hypothetical protein